MKIEPLGDAAYLLRGLDRPAYEVAAALNDAHVPGLLEAVASYDTVGLYVDQRASEFPSCPLSIEPSNAQPRKSTRSRLLHPWPRSARGIRAARNL